MLPGGIKLHGSRMISHAAFNVVQLHYLLWLFRRVEDRAIIGDFQLQFAIGCTESNCHHGSPDVLHHVVQCLSDQQEDF